MSFSSYDSSDSHSDSSSISSILPVADEYPKWKRSSDFLDRASTSWLDLSPDEPFNFLGLPKEVRLMVYELLPRKVIRRFVINECIVEVSDKCCNPAILSTCRLIYQEAHQLIFNALHHDGPRLHLDFRGLNADHLLFICDKLRPSRPTEDHHFRDKDHHKATRHIMSKAAPFDVRLFELRSYMRTPKDYEAHIDWFPTKYSKMTNREFLGRFVCDLGRLYCTLANHHDYTVSLWDGERMVSLLEFLNRRIPREFGERFHEKLSRDGFVTWKDIICRSAGRRATSYWLWRQH